MSTQNFTAARQYALDRLETEIPSTIYYHDITHTRDEVLPALNLFAGHEQINSNDLIILRTAGYFHDIGFIFDYTEHVEFGVKIANQILPSYDYSQNQIDEILNLIRATRLPQTPKTHLEEILADADLSILGSEDFLERNHLLYLERIEYFGDISIIEWYNQQIEFLKQHCYFTDAAKKFNRDRKLRNIRTLEEKVQALEGKINIIQ